MNWTITDIDISDNQQYIIHSSLNPYIGLFDTTTLKYKQMIDITSTANNISNDDDDYDSQLRLTSVRFNHNNTQILSGSFQ